MGYSPNNNFGQKAGGHITNWKGKDPKAGGSILVSSSSILHKKILTILKPVL